MTKALSGVVLLTMLFSCSSNPGTHRSAETDNLPTDLYNRQGNPPDRVTGIWEPCLEEKRMEADASVEIRFFNSGIIMFCARWSGKTPSHVSFGEYRYDSAEGELLVDSESPVGTLITNVQGYPPFFTMEGIRFTRIAMNPSEEPQPEPETLAGAWHLSYVSVGKTSAVTLFLYKSGTFVETTSYGNGDDLLSETGSWQLSQDEGLIEFTFDRLPEADFIAFIYPSENIIVTPVGEFRKTIR